MREPVVLPAAVRDIDQQAVYYRDQGSPDTATRRLERTRRTFEFAADNPGLGAMIGPGLRVWRIERFEHHNMVYRTMDERTEIIRVLHGASDLDLLL